MSNSLSRKIDHRQSLLRNLATSLILYEEIRTTKAKAREVKSVVERLISRTKKDKSSLTSRRYLLGYFYDKNATKKMLEVIVPRFSKIDSGFVRIIPIGPRLGDNAQMVIIKLQEGKKPPIEEGKTEKGADDASAKKASQKIITRPIKK